MGLVKSARGFTSLHRVQNLSVGGVGGVGGVSSIRIGARRIRSGRAVKADGAGRCGDGETGRGGGARARAVLGVAPSKLRSREGGSARLAFRRASLAVCRQKEHFAVVMFLCGPKPMKCSLVS